MANEHNKRTGIPAIQYRGVEASSPLQMIYQKRDPQPHDKHNYPIGCWWVNTTNNNVWTLVSLENNTATWLQFNTSIGDILGIQTATGLSVPDAARTFFWPDGTLINTFNVDMNTIGFGISNGGDGQTIIGQGANPPVWGDLTSQTHSITITPDLIGPGTINLDIAVPANPTTYTTQAGNAIEALGILNVIGAGGITTAGAGNTITVSLANPPVPAEFHTQAGNATPALNVLNILGSTYINTTGAGNTVTISLAPAGGQGRTTNNCNFLAYLNAPMPNAVGGANFYDLPANTILFDTGGNYNTGNFTFTAPRNGTYYFIFSVLYYNISMAVTFDQSIIYARTQVNNPTFFPGVTEMWTAQYKALQNIVVYPGIYGNSLQNSGTFIRALNAGDRVKIIHNYSITQPAVQNVGVYGAAPDHMYTYFGGYQIY